MALPYSASIRPATPDDAAALADLGRRTFLETFVEEFAIPYPKADLDRFIAEVFDISVVQVRLEHPDHVWDVAQIDGVIGAFSETGPASMPHPDLRPEHGELRRLYVAREHQGKGLGKALLERALARLDQTPGPQWLSVWSGNEKAQALYRAYGFEKAGEYGFPVGSWRDHEFIFRRGLAP